MKNHILTNKFTIREMLEDIKQVGWYALAGKEFSPMKKKIDEYLEMIE
jgi:hypothetical protein